MIKPMIDCHSRVKIYVIAQSFHVPSRFSSARTPFANQSLVHTRKPRAQVQKGVIRRRARANVGKSRHAGSTLSSLKRLQTGRSARRGGIISRLRHLGL